MNIFLIVLGKFASFIATTFHLGSGSTWPGHIALIVNKHFIRDILSKNSIQVILIAGTNGKTTTSKLLQFIAEKHRIHTFHNEEGANLLNGIASTIIRYANTSGKITGYTAAIFEVDENSLSQVLEQITPQGVIILNLFRDQLDRYGEVNSIAKKWQQAIVQLPESTNVILNGDDPQLYYIGTQTKARVSYFGISKDLMSKKDVPHDVDSIHCPNCKKKLTYLKRSYSHLGDFICKFCSFKRERVIDYNDISLSYPLQGIYIIYNTHAALLAAQTLFHHPIEEIIKDLEKFTPAFGRQEIIEYHNKKIFLLLSKNPTGFNQSIDTVLNLDGKKKNFLLALNDRIADGRDVSWIWDVDFEQLIPHAHTITISGDRAYDLALRLKYAFYFNNQTPHLAVFPKLKEALHHLLTVSHDGETAFILPTYTAMLDVRKLLVGKKLL